MSLLITGIERKGMKAHDNQIVYNAIMQSGFLPNVVVTGRRRGIERAAVKWCKRNAIGVERYNPKIESYSSKDVRNARLVKMCTVAIIIWDGEDPEHADIIRRCHKLNIPTHIVVL